MKKKLAITLGLVLLIITAVFSVSLFSQKGKERSMNENLFIETDFGTIEIEFYPDKAPNHVQSIKKLANEGFYDGTTFHRVIPGFMIQGGDPNSRLPDKSIHGTGGPDFSLDQEFNDVSHKRGIVSMARSQNPDSAGSQFFIMVADSPQLDGQYTVWGNVVNGMDVVDKIVGLQRDRNDNPVKSATMKKVYTK